MNSLLLVLGLLMILIGFVLILLSSIGKRVDVKGGGIVMIGPIPIILGGKGLRPILLFTIFIIIIFLFLTFTLLGVTRYV
ncbi:MAG: DUF131 domain-containing protein [Aigarchaeota archaeon]|nr:DUF131 domain-containing protein [Aigarchaeota archaeon]